MTDTYAPPPAPAQLGPRGAALWRAVTEPLMLDPHEAEQLERACTMADRLDQLDAAVERDGLMVDGARGSQRLHPAVAEHRAVTIAQARVLSALRLPPGYSDGSSRPGGSPQHRSGVRGFYSVKPGG